MEDPYREELYGLDSELSWSALGRFWSRAHHAIKQAYDMEHEEVKEVLWGPLLKMCAERVAVIRTEDENADFLEYITDDIEADAAVADIEQKGFVAACLELWPMQPDEREALLADVRRQLEEMRDYEPSRKRVESVLKAYTEAAAFLKENGR